MLPIPNLHKFLLSIYPAETWWCFINDGAFGIGSAFFASVLFTYNWGQDFMNWRVFSPTSISIGPGNHHTDIMILLGLAFYLAVYLKVNPLFATLGLYFAVEAHEAEWYVAYVSWKVFYGSAAGLFKYSWLTICVLMLPIMFFYVWTFGFPWKFFAFMAPFYAAWYAVGFPITQDFYEHTAFYLTPWVNLLEFASWAWAVVGFFLFVYPTLRRASDKIKIPWSTDLQPMVNFIRLRMRLR